MDNLKSKVQDYQASLNILDGQLQLLNKQKLQLDSDLEEIKDQRTLFKKEVEVAELAHQKISRVIKDQLEIVVTKALQTVYGDSKKFYIQFDKRGNLSTAKFLITDKDKTEPLDILETTAGGERDIVSFALRIILLEICQTKNKTPLITDEPFKNLSSDYDEASGEFLHMIKDKMNRQIIMVTHKKSHYDLADNKLEITKLTTN